jgi:hypothetical protein
MLVSAVSPALISTFSALALTMPSNGDFRAGGEAVAFEAVTVFGVSAGALVGDDS